MKHGMYKSRIYKTWDGMLTRCYQPTHESYKRYGKKGITVCDEWKTFIPFFKWAMANGYRDDLFIDRKDGKGNYEPDNCRFGTRLENNNNYLVHAKLTIFGETKNISEWTRDPRCVVKAKTFRSRVQEKGIPPEIALTHKVQQGLKLPR